MKIFSKKAQKNLPVQKLSVPLQRKSKTTLSNFALWCNGSTSDSGSACEGSNPSKATKRKSQLINFTQLRFFYCSKRME